jgi:hypothetical protein
VRIIRLSGIYASTDSRKRCTLLPEPELIVFRDILASRSGTITNLSCRGEIAEVEQLLKEFPAEETKRIFDDIAKSPLLYPSRRES